MSSVLSFPAHVLRGNGCLDQIFTIIKSKRICVFGGHKALKVVTPLLTELMEAKNVDCEICFHWFGGEVSPNNINKMCRQAKAFNADVIFAVGGGKAIDAGKAAADKTGLPVVTIPTIAATCAAVSAVSILYDEHGQYDDMFHLAKAPDVVVLDGNIIAKGPVRWLAAGLGDTLAKLYEYRVISGGHPDLSLNMAAYANGKVCFDIIERFGSEAVQEVALRHPGKALEQVMDAIFTFAGFTSIMGVGDHVAAAHALFEGFTVLEKTRSFGHGLLVGFGNLCLLVLEGREDHEVLEAIKLAKACQVPTSLDEIAFLTKEELMQVAEKAVRTSDMDNMPTVVTEAKLIHAMHYVSELSRSAAPMTSIG
ncbi:iron-containing alcohol dehydrogenase family protein [Vibrio salinus]|uniref:iron-containing alcohol dehydrogenase family protein n=1 Tax=Vibrio salinus TaxID=2899784 RepID=UPI001E3408C6|nr:iron-containing alcohol dehydrogenase family protein [Vibrio salinus]MCE0493139.1 iron-containing alcohol dehydrogenase family protein [Vibrio salinus]